MALTKRQKQVLYLLVSFQNKKGYAPSYEEIAKGLDLASLAAGKPLESVEDRETISLSDFTRSKDVFVLKVKGESMVDDHILDGDYVVVEPTQVANNGEIVVALVGGDEATLKRFYREGAGRIRLQPANSAMEPIRVAAADVRIQGRVLGVLRKY